ncbi:aminotransferase class V-fold PLP-dependent enzyme [Acrocarpospora sp. B8E8]|uniref:aminotransferase class V-fold PLP-dependent enzyme n=1 Tax=Acrocarpospora sp. B8E8 TaxID=3153572 RepID=UPI00325C9F25
MQTTRLREQARAIVHQAVGGGPDDLVIFCGSGATAAINKLIGILELRIPRGLADRYRLLDRIPPEERPVVFVGPYEHHSNELPWRESIAEVVVISEDHDGHIDLPELEAQLVRHAGRPLLIGSFSAASNVTGILRRPVPASARRPWPATSTGPALFWTAGPTRSTTAIRDSPTTSKGCWFHLPRICLTS